MASLAASTQREYPRTFHCIQTPFERCVCRHLCELTVVQTGPFEARLVEIETQRLNEMQSNTRVCAQTNDISRVGWDLGFVKNKTEKSLIHCLFVAASYSFPGRACRMPHRMIFRTAFDDGRGH